MNRTQHGTSSFPEFKMNAAAWLKRTVAFCGILVVMIAIVSPVFTEQSTADQMVPSGPRAIDTDRWISFHKLMMELEKRVKRFHGDTGILIKDLRTGQIITINNSKLFPSASLVKVPIMAAYFAAQKEGRLSLEDEITLERQHKIRSCSHLYFAKTGSRFAIRDLIERMITESDNTATNMLTDELGFAYLNQKFMEFGLKNTDIRRGVMDLRWREAGIENYTTADDMAALLEKIYRRELVSPEASDQMMAVLKRQKVNDRIPRWLPPDMVIAHKTGLLRDTVSDVGIVFAPGGDFVICVLTGDINNYKMAKRFIGRVAAAAYSRCYKTELTAKSSS